MVARPKFSSALNAARFGVGLLVMLVHFLPLPLVAEGAPAALLQLLNTRNLTSSFFFLLSGFLVAMTSTRGERDEDPLPFAIKRMSRLWPAHVAAFVLMIPLGVLELRPESLQRFAGESLAWLTMTHGFLPSMAMEYNGPAWAVTSFALGYAAVPFVVRWKNCPISQLVALALALWLAPLIMQSVLVFGSMGPWDAQVTPRLSNSPGVEFLQRFIHSSPLFRVPEVLCGAVAALISRRLAGGAGNFLVWLAPALLAGLFVIGGVDDRWLFFFTHGALTPLLVLTLGALWKSDGWLERVCSRPWLRRGGQSGILIYFLHRPVFRVMDAAYRLWSGAGVHETERSLGLALAAALATTIAAYLIQPAYDRMCKRLAAALLDRKPAAELTKAEVMTCAR